MGENGILRERTGFHGKEWDFTGENGILQERTFFFCERTGFHEKSRDFMGEYLDFRDDTGFNRFTGENRISR